MHQGPREAGPAGSPAAPYASASQPGAGFGAATLRKNLNSKPQKPENRSRGSRAFTDGGADTWTGVNGGARAAPRGVPGQGAVTRRASVCSTPPRPVTCSTSPQVCSRVTLRPCGWRGFGRIQVPGDCEATRQLPGDRHSGGAVDAAGVTPLRVQGQRA